MSEINPYVPPAARMETGEVQPDIKPQAIGGWLILVALIVVVSPLRIVFVVFPIYAGLVSDGSWAALTTPGSAVYNPSLSTFIMVEAALNCAIFLSWLYLAFLLFSKRRKFPKVFIMLLAATLAIQFLDAWVIQVIVPDQKAFDQETMVELGRTIIACAIWIPYMLTSQRVKATFVK